jgi:indole-3-glycerol phosphate synthase
VLAELLDAARARAAALRPRRRELERAAEIAPVRPAFAAALIGDAVAIIAEVKRASPSGGAINPAMDAAVQAVAYEQGGAAAVSVLTEPSRFNGTLMDLETASNAAHIPLLHKDFIVAEEQVLESRAAGASGILLIARALPRQRLQELASFARDAGLEPLIEIRDEWELAAAVTAGARVVGINARDLETLDMSPDRVGRLVPMVPGDCICVAESGLRTRADVMAVADSGVDAVLLGTALSAARNPKAAVRDLTGIPRRPRAAGD